MDRPFRLARFRFPALALGLAWLGLLPAASAQSPAPNAATDGMEVFPPTWRSDGLYDPEFYPFIDVFGQYRHLTWTDKVTGDSDLLAKYAAEQTELALLRPASFGTYGGWKHGPKLEATGFFRTAKVDGKWWLVDPEGYLFHSSGLTTVSSVVRTDASGASAMRTGITNRETFFEPLPATGHPARTLGLLANETATVTSGEYQGQRPLAANFFAMNALKQLPTTVTLEDLRAATTTLAFDRMRSWGFTTIGAWSDPDLFVRAGRQPYTHMLQPTHPGLIRGSTTYLDYFKDAWVTNLRARLNAEVGLTIGDPWNLGYYIDNERDWTKSNVSARSLGLWVLGAPSENLERYAKRAFRDQLQAKYGTIGALNAQWGVTYASWDDVLTRTDVAPAAAGSDADMAAFEVLYAETYFSKCRQVMREIAPQHLYLGCRFTTGARPPVLEVAARYSDVVTINVYGNSVRLLTGMEDDADVPVMCTEYYFYSHDSGLFADAVGSGTERSSQTARASAMKSYIASSATHTRYVGTHWFQYFDYPPSGRLNSRNMNSNLGFVSTANLPYSTMVKAAREANYAMYRTRFAPPKRQVAADAVATSTSPGTPLGTGSYLEVSGTKHAYLRFDLGSVSSPIERAILFLHPLEGDALATHELALVADNAWTEDTLTWNTRPAATATLARWTTKPDLAVEIDITRELREAFRADRRLVFRLSSADGTMLRYAAREHGTDTVRPQILLVTGPATLSEWRAQYFLPDSDQAGNAADPDADGHSNLMEYALALSPHESDATAGPQIGLGPDGRLTATFYRARADVTYSVEASSDLVQWTTLATNPGSAGATVTVTDTATTSPRFLRLRVSVP